MSKRTKEKERADAFIEKRIYDIMADRALQQKIREQIEEMAWFVRQQAEDIAGGHYDYDATSEVIMKVLHNVETMMGWAKEIEEME